jgi:acetyl esterase/lipase
MTSRRSSCHIRLDQNRTAEEPMDRALAASGLLVVAIDMTLAPEAPYPACVQDANDTLDRRRSGWKDTPWRHYCARSGISVTRT